ncbi:AbrB/MazE/SpoVT family DNA-binding domain-containing protein [Methylophilus sp. 13]|uniref:AbrB/MazE/SpoVT family DNA-binding domain-containing protein n=1 Tax=Methylophilus sp. 13 TaxID=2781018 RepID=UPI001E3579F3|nr:AbrB/MazE/SpoVT family DNA-binding domain-containing protein [Methylophilus sp. 13]
MMFQTLRKVGNSFVMTLPEAFIEQNGLSVGSQVKLHMRGAKMIVEARNTPRYNLVDLMAEMAEGLPSVEGWEGMPSVGQESP